MKKILLKTLLLSTSLLTLGATVVPTEIVLASEQTITDNQESSDNSNISIQKDEHGDIVVVKMDKNSNANVAHWGAWQYTNIAVSTGVAANAINTALYFGIGSVIGIFGGIPTWAIQGLLNGAGWTKKGSKPGKAVANLWDKNHNGWILLS